MAPTMNRFTLNHPHPDHRPTVGRVQTGLTWRGGQCYGTTLRCSCGWAPRIQKINGRLDDGSWGVVREHPDYKVSNEAPSKGGWRDAQEAYQRHLTAVLAEEASRG